MRYGNAKDGYYHDAPYTSEEDFEFYRRVGGATSLTIVKAPGLPIGTVIKPKAEDLSPILRRILKATGAHR